MKTIRFYADENVPSTITEELQQLGYDVLTAYEAQQVNKSISDENVLKFAQKQDKTILTLNRNDSIFLHKKVKNIETIGSFYLSISILALY